MADTLTLNFVFPDIDTKEAFKTAFQGWLKTYQQQASVVQAIKAGTGGEGTGTGGEGTGTGGEGTGTGEGAPGTHAGAIDFPTWGKIYLNFINRW